jgi:ribosome-binding protein aMBF1 (putative translation factor)
MNLPHQDWTPVVLYNPKATNTKEENKKETPTTSKKIRELDGDDIVAPPKANHDLKKAIQQARLASKKSQKQLASELGIQTQILNHYESGKEVPNNTFLAKLEKKLNVKLPRNNKHKN